MNDKKNKTMAKCGESVSTSTEFTKNPFQSGLELERLTYVTDRQFFRPNIGFRQRRPGLRDPLLVGKVHRIDESLRETLCGF